MPSTVRRTRYPELGYEKQGHDVWRFIDLQTFRAIGPFYRTRAELLADLSNFHRDRFYMSPWRLED